MQKFKISKKQNLEQGAVILLLSTVLTKLIGALFKIPLSSNICLGDLGFGYFSAAYDLFTPVYMLALSGFPVAISRIVAEYTAKNIDSAADKIFKASRKSLLILGIIGTVVLAIAVIPFAIFADNGENSIWCYFAIVPAFLFCCLVSAYRGYYEGVLNMVPAAVSNIIEALCKLVLGFSFAYFTVKITGNVALAAAFALVGITLGTLLSTVYLHLKYKRDLKHIALDYEADLELRDFSIFKMLIFTAVPIVLSSLSGSLVTLIDTLTVRQQLNKLVTENFAELSLIYKDAVSQYGEIADEALKAGEFSTFLYGIKSKAYTVYYLIPTLTTALGISAVPVLAKAMAMCDKQQIKISSMSILKLISIIVFPAALGMFCLSDRIMALLYGKGASALVGGSMLLIFAIAAIFAGFSVPLCSILQALALEKTALINVGIGMMVKLLGNLVLCPIQKLNIMGCVISTLLCYILIFFLNISALLRKTGYAFEILSVFLKPLFASIMCGFTAILVSKIGDNSMITVLSILLGGLVYVVFLFLFKTVSREEIALFCKK